VEEDALGVVISIVIVPVEARGDVARRQIFEQHARGRRDRIGEPVAEDERLQPLLTPFIGFLDVKDRDFEPADNIDELLDEAATAIPRAAIILRKIAQFRTRPTAGRRSKIGRNDPCPCGSGLKYKRCCGANQAAPN
jgi:hypothetical protein